MINRKIQMNGIEYYLVSITISEGTTSLWIIHEQTVDIEGHPRKNRYNPNQTNREMIIDNPNRPPIMKSLDIQEIVFGEKNFTVGSHSCGRLHDYQGRAYTRMQHFIEKGMPLEILKSMNLYNVCLSNYDLMEGEVFEMEEVDSEEVITIHTPMLSRSIPVQMKLSLQMGRYDEAIEVDVAVPENDKVVHCYINGVENYDLWASGIGDDLSNKPKDLTEEQYEDWRSCLLRGYERLCPRDKNLAVVLYEVDVKASARFHTSKWLSSPISENVNGSMAIIFGYGGDEETGLKGYRLLGAQLEAIEKDFDGTIDVELIDITETLPARTYVFD